MSKLTMGSGAAMGLPHSDPHRAFRWIWHALLQALAELPLLRVLCAAALGLVALAVYLAAGQGGSLLEMALFGLLAGLYALIIPVIYYFLFEIYRKHRSDAIFDSHRLTHLIRKLAQEEIEAAYDGRGASLGATLPQDRLG